MNTTRQARLFAAAVLLALVALPVYAYTVNYSQQGRVVRWKHRTGRVTKKVFFTSNLGSPWDASFLSALGTWNGVGARFLWYYNPRGHVARPSDRKNSGAWTFIDGASNTLAITYSFSNAKGRLKETDIVFDNGDRWTINGNVGSGIIDFETVALHEAGHALGLGHESAFPSIMAPYYAGARRSLYPDDGAGMYYLYP